MCPRYEGKPRHPELIAGTRRTDCWCGANCRGQAGAMLRGPARRRERQEPARRGVTTRRPAGRGHGSSGPPLNDLALQFAPQRHWTPAGRPFTSEGKRAGRTGHGQDLPAQLELGHTCRQRHTRSDLGFCLRVEHRTFSLHRKRSSDRQTKNSPDLRSPLTESNRRPSPYHVSLRSSAVPGRAADLREHEHTLALTSTGLAHASAICHSICHSL